MKRVRIFALAAVACLVTPHLAHPAELWLTCGPMAIGGRCKTEGAMGFYNDARERQISSQVTCFDQTYKPLDRYDCYPLSDPLSPGNPDLRVVCNGKAKDLVLPAEEYNDWYRRCRKLCAGCTYGDWH